MLAGSKIDPLFVIAAMFVIAYGGQIIIALLGLSDGRCKLLLHSYWYSASHIGICYSSAHFYALDETITWRNE
jgi:hypothetical protein